MKKYSLLFGLVIVGFLLGYGGIAKAFLGRDDFYGYFKNHYQSSGDYVLADGIPSDVNSKQDFIDFLFTQDKSNAFYPGTYYDGSTQDRVGTSFLVNVILGYLTSPPFKAPGMNKGGTNLTVSQINTFKNDIIDFTTEPNSDWDTSGNAPDNQVRWNVNTLYNVNSLYQTSYQDDTFYHVDDTHDPAIVFQIGNDIIGIKRKCSNVIYHEGINPPSNFTIMGKTTVTYPGTTYDNGTNGGNAGSVPVGTTLNFKHYLEDAGSNDVGGTVSWETHNTDAGKIVDSGNILGSTLSGSNLKKWQQLTAANETYVTKSNDLTSNGGSGEVCRQVYYQPTSDSDNGQSNGGKVCVKVTGTSQFTIKGKTTVTYGSTTYDNDTAGGITITVPIGATVVFKHYLENTGNNTSPAIDWRTRDTVAQTTIASGTHDGMTNNGWNQLIGTAPNNLATEWYTTKQSDVGNKICRRVNYQPTSDTDSTNGYNGQPVCVQVMNVSCDATVTAQPGKYDDSGTITVTVTKTSGSISGYYVTQDPNGPATWSLANKSSQSKNYVVNNSANPPWGSQNIVTYTYTINDSSGKGVNNCSAKISWPPPPPNKPYFKVTGGDVFTGGGFANADGTCDVSESQAPNYSNLSSTEQEGGIYAFAASGKGASSQYAAYSLGAINGNSGSQYGFYTQGTSKNTLSFANYNFSGNDWGGLFGGSTPQAHCVPDYYDTYTKDLTSGSIPSSISSGTSETFFSNSGSTVTINDGSIGAGNTVTVFVKGNVYIKGNITYPASYSDSSIPKFALVVLGSIYVYPNVTQLDGLYVAQPNTGVPNWASSSTDTGNIWTCNDGSGSSYSAANVVSNCNQKLTFNGSVVAKQVNLWRISASGIAGQSDGLNAGATPYNLPGNPNTPVEVFNYIPAMAVGPQFFSGGQQDWTVENVTPMPPVY